MVFNIAYKKNASILSSQNDEKHKLMDELLGIDNSIKISKELLVTTEK